MKMQQKQTEKIFPSITFLKLNFKNGKLIFVYEQSLVGVSLDVYRSRLVVKVCIDDFSVGRGYV